MQDSTTMTLEECWTMVNGIQDGKTPQDVRARCAEVRECLAKNENISNKEYDDLMRTAAYLCRESYQEN